MAALLPAASASGSLCVSMPMFVYNRCITTYVRTFALSMYHGGGQLGQRCSACRITAYFALSVMGSV